MASPHNSGTPTSRGGCVPPRKSGAIAATLTLCGIAIFLGRRMLMDEIDVKILKCLRANSRENASIISEKVNMSVSAVIERIRKLESSGLVVRHTTIIDAAKAGKDVTAFISVSLEHPKYIERFNTFVRENREILESHYITGDFDFLLKVATDNTQTLERLLNSVKSVTGVQNTLTIVILSTIKSEHSIDPEELLKQ
jgi:Lrp/AsnC family leucine-responsive transcriptional regulator